MNIYGYAVENEQLLTMKEVSFQLSPNELRAISKFLLSEADRMEDLGDSYGHSHLKDYDNNFKSLADLIVHRNVE